LPPGMKKLTLLAPMVLPLTVDFSLGVAIGAPKVVDPKIGVALGTLFVNLILVNALNRGIQKEPFFLDWFGLRGIFLLVAARTALAGWTLLVRIKVVGQLQFTRLGDLLS
jgi:hypothetical protein